MAENDVVEEKSTTKESLSVIRRKAVQMRWLQVEEDREDWIRPFHDLRIDKALEYHDRLQKIWEEGARIINERQGSGKNIKCSGPHCGKNLSGLKANGMVPWVSKKDFKDLKRPGIMISLYFCSEECNNLWVRKQQGGGGTDGK